MMSEDEERMRHAREDRIRLFLTAVGIVIALIVVYAMYRVVLEVTR